MPLQADVALGSKTRLKLNRLLGVKPKEARMQGIELEKDHLFRFSSQAQWEQVARENPWIFSADYIEEAVRAIRANGLRSEVFGLVPPSEIAIEGSNYRETIEYRQLKSRHRAVIELFHRHPKSLDYAEARIFCSEGITPFAAYLRSKYRYFLGTEYLPTQADRDRHFPIRNGDLLDIDAPSDTFDFMLSNDVLEHVPRLDESLAEQARCLKPGGFLLGTVPFALNAEKSQVFAVQPKGASIQFLRPPEFHHNPVSTEGSLVFEIPGWDLLDRFRAAGFRQAEMLFWSSVPRGIIGAEISGVALFRAMK